MSTRFRAEPPRPLPALQRGRVEHDAELHELRAELVADAHRRDRVRIEIDVDALDFVAVAQALATGTKTLNRSAIVGYAWPPSERT